MGWYSVLGLGATSGGFGGDGGDGNACVFSGTPEGMFGEGTSGAAMLSSSRVTCFTLVSCVSRPPAERML